MFGIQRTYFYFYMLLCCDCTRWRSVITGAMHTPIGDMVGHEQDVGGTWWACYFVEVHVSVTEQQ